MSDVRVALVAEGPTDAIVIGAALKALLPSPFVLTLLQPESTRPQLGTGWGGVLRWCLEFAGRGHPNLEADPTLPGFDIFIIHLDADVAEDNYKQVSDEIAEIASQRVWPALPNGLPCPPSAGSSDIVRALPLAWAGLSALGPKTVLCVPSKAIGAWLASAIFDDGHKLLTDLECNLNLETQLGVLPKSERIKKSARDYATREAAITSAWALVRQRCTQANRFSIELGAVIA